MSQVLEGLGGYAGGTAIALAEVTWWDAFLGNLSGSMGETSTLACLLGAVALVGTGIGSWPSLGPYFEEVATDYATGAVINDFICDSMVYSDHAPFWNDGFPAVFADGTVSPSTSMSFLSLDGVSFRAEQ